MPYQAEGDGYSNFHLYVCAAFLITWTKELQKMDFQVRFRCAALRRRAIPARIAERRSRCCRQRPLGRVRPQELMIYLQSLPSSKWSYKEVELLLSEAFMWKTLFQNNRHLNTVES